MLFKEVDLNEMLLAREMRQSIQRELIQKHNKTVVSFTLNIVGAVKNSELIFRTFNEGVRLINDYCISYKFDIIENTTYTKNTGCEGYFVIDEEATMVKKALTEIENSPYIGRLFDIDVINLDGTKVSRADIGAPNRKCLICDADAFVCSRSRNHRIDEIFNRTCDLMNRYFAEQYAKTISSLAIKAMLFEVNVTPKPGLVDRNNTGSHKDMDIFTFCSSSAQLSAYFYEAVMCSITHHNLSEDELFYLIRALGINAEREMFLATEQINTHKGLVFSLGIMCAALGYMYANNVQYSENDFITTCENMSKHLHYDLDDDKKGPQSNGEKIYKQHKIMGIRGQAMNGFREVFCVGVNRLTHYLHNGYSINDAGVLTLLHIMSSCDDTNIIARSSAAKLDEVKGRIKDLLDSYVENKDYIKIVKELDNTYINQNISPGGSADLLALSFFLYFVEGLS